ncbi:MAG TPA: FliH/SctL family protein [Burkholderiaceae bacterium]|nr:FliH/SctL family protein [Burkholderiaceae bacterium]
MTFVLWQRGRDTGIASNRLVLRAAEVPLLAEAQAVRDRLEALHTEQAHRVEAACEEARQRGHALGLEQGVLAAGDEVAASLMAMARAAEQESVRVRGQVAALALQVARKLIGQLADDERLLALADTAARDMMPGSSSTLVVHPSHADALRVRLAAMARHAGEGGAPAPSFELRADPACALDSCRIETEFGSVDASLNAQLNRLADAWGVSERP